MSEDFCHLGSEPSRPIERIGSDWPIEGGSFDFSRRGGGALRERAEGFEAKLLDELDVKWLEHDEAVEDAEAMIVAKRGLNRTLAEVDAEVTSLQLSKLDVEAFINRLSKEGVHLLNEASKSREKAAELSTKFEAARAEVA
ncbi:hypothetical protein ACLOJK_040989 [Asimina triloba]